MDPVTSTATNWIQIVNTGGIVGLLVLNLWMFASGNIVPKTMVDLILKGADERTTKMADEIKVGIKDAVKAGIVEGIHEVREVRKE